MSGSLSLTQQKALAVTPKCGGALSIPSNLFIIYEIACDHRSSRGSNAIQRVIVGMSVIDMLSTTGWFLSSWALPRPETNDPMTTTTNSGGDSVSYETTTTTAAISNGTSYSDSSSESSFFYGAIGNRATCSFQGFLLQLAIGAPLYNCSLALLYLLVIKYRWTDQQLAQIEKWIHGMILSFSIGTAILLLPLDQYNASGVVCWVNGSPAGCTESVYYHSNVPCDRGQGAWIYGIVFFYGVLWICVMACIGSMFMLHSEVRKVQRRVSRYSLTDGRSTVSLNRSKEDSARVAKQAILYSLSFLVTWAPSTLWSVALWFNVSSFGIDYAAAFCEPLQGFWNLLIFASRRRSTRAKIRRVLRTVLPCCHSADDDHDRNSQSQQQHRHHHGDGSSSLMRDPSFYMIRTRPSIFGRRRSSNSSIFFGGRSSWTIASAQAKRSTVISSDPDSSQHTQNAAMAAGVEAAAAAVLATSGAVMEHDDDDEDDDRALRHLQRQLSRSHSQQHQDVKDESPSPTKLARHVTPGHINVEVNGATEAATVESVVVAPAAAAGYEEEEALSSTSASDLEHGMASELIHPTAAATTTTTTKPATIAIASTPTLPDVVLPIKSIVVCQQGSEELDVSQLKLSTVLGPNVGDDPNDETTH